MAGSVQLRWPAGYMGVKRFALLLAVLWWAQLPICLLADGGDHAHGQAAATRTVVEHHHGEHDGGAPAVPGRDDQDTSCAEHCASLARAVPVYAAAAPAPAPCAVLASSAALVLPEPRSLLPRAACGRQPPPDPTLPTAVLRL